MAVEKLTQITLSGPLNQFDWAVRLLVLDRNFHPESAPEQLAAIKTLQPFDLTNPYPPLMQRIEQLAKTLEIPLRPKAYDPKPANVNRVSRYIEEVEKVANDLEKRQRERSLLAADWGQLLETLHRLLHLEESLDALFHMKTLAFRFGRLPQKIYNEAREHIHSRSDFFFLPTSQEADFVYCMYFLLPQNEEAADAFFLALHFQSIQIPPMAYGTPEAAIRRIEAKRIEAETEAARLNLRLEALRDVAEGKLREYWTCLSTLSRAWSLRQYAGHTEERFYLVGWIPRAEAAAYTARVGQLPGFSCVLSPADKLPHMAPPIQFRQGFLARTFRPLVEMYGLPHYRELDPSLFLALIYILLFGVMFGDVGQGFVLILTGLLLKGLKNMWIGPILSLAGISSLLFGFVYGSVFGYEHLLPGFRVLEGRGPMQILALSMGAGILLILTSMAINIINGIRQKNPGKSLFSPNGLAGLVCYIAVLAGCFAHFFLDKSLFTTPYVGGLILTPLALMLFEVPLSKLLQGKRPWFPAQPLSFLTEGLFHLFEIALSFVSNTISFLRVGAFAIIHAGLMLVVLLLAQRVQTAGLFVILFGNLFVIALEALLVSIQLLRLGFYELFGRFYTGGGKKFTPERSCQITP